MLKIDKVQTVEGVTIYGDDNAPNKFYLLPDKPRFRINEDGLPAFTFIKYRMPITREDGKVGGGFLVFDSEFAITPEKEQAIRTKLQEQLDQLFADFDPKPQVEFGTITWTKGTAKLNLEDGFSGFIEKVHNPGKPSLYGHLITPYTVELTPEGSALLEAALQGKGGFVQVMYDLWCMVKLPPIRARIWFDSYAFYSFIQDFEKTQHIESIFGDICDWLFGGDDEDTTTITNTISEVSSKGQWGGVDLHFDSELPDSKANQEMQDKIRTWAFDTLRQAMKDMMAAPTQPVSEEQRKVPPDVTTFKQNISQFNFSSFEQAFTEEHAVAWNLAPQGMLEPVTNLKNKDGQPFKWEDFARTVDLDDPFFRQLAVPVRVNADLKSLPIDSVEVHLDYNQGNTHRIDEFSFTSPDQLQKFKSFIENNNWQYSYHYQVNYKGESQAFTSEDITTDDKFLTINVGDTGVLAIDIAPGDLNFSQVTQAQVKLTYEADGDAGLIEREVILDRNNPQHAIREVIFTPVDKPYNYTVKYFMADGKEYQVAPAESRSPRLYINDPFGAMKTIGVRAAGDLDKDIATIFVDLKYIDEVNDYIKTTLIALSKTQPFFDWTFPVIDEKSGKVLYSGNIQYRDGRVEDLEEQEATASTIMAGKRIEDVLDVTVLAPPRLVDFGKVQIVQVSMHYADQPHEVEERADLLFESNSKQVWSVPLKDKTKTTYDWEATFFMADGSTRTIPNQPSNKLSIVLQTPMA